jgi:hypothetical protein
MTDISEARSRQRFVAIPPLEGRFNRVPILVYNLGEGGVQIEHSLPLKMGTTGSVNIRMHHQPEAVEFRGRVVWSRLSKTPDSTGKYLYRSGVRVDENEETARDFLRRLISSSARPEVGSLERKRQLLAQRAKGLATRPLVISQTQPGPTVSPDQLLIIRQAWERLQSNPDEATKWYNRVRFTKLEKEAEDLQAHRDDILATWEYLERSIDLHAIATVFNSVLKK